MFLFDVLYNDEVDMLMMILESKGATPGIACG